MEQDKTSDYPKFGMALEPKIVAAGTDEEENAALHDMTR
jgi:hypothetical protein